jgi:hypothetical protein
MPFAPTGEALLQQLLHGKAVRRRCNLEVAVQLGIHLEIQIP